jgi:hypothetical protein
MDKHDYSDLLKVRNSSLASNQCLTSQWLYASTIVYIPAAFFTRATLLLLIARVFATRKVASYSVYAFIGFIAAIHIPLLGLRIAVCSPIKAFWDHSASGHCLDQRIIVIAYNSVAVFTDVAIIVIPILLVWKMKVSRRRRFRIIVVLGAGGAATGITIWRMVKAVSFTHSNDVGADIVILMVLW